MTTVLNSQKSIDDDIDMLLSKPNQRPISRIHIRLQQRNGKKTITIIEGLADDLNLKKIVSAMKRTLQTSGAALKTEKHGDIIQLNGDHRESAKNFIVKYKIWEEPDSKIIMHGF